MNHHKVLFVFYLLMLTLVLSQEVPFNSKQVWQLQLGQHIWRGQLSEESNGIWLGNGIMTDSREEQLLTLAPLSLEEKETFNLPEPKREYWVFTLNLYDKNVTDSGTAYKCVVDLAKGAYLETGELVSVSGKRFDYTITIAGPQLREGVQRCFAWQPG